MIDVKTEEGENGMSRMRLSVSIKHEGGPDGHEILETEVIKYQICAKSDCANEEIYPVDMEEDRTK
jgi:hypothetical protein